MSTCLAKDAGDRYQSARDLLRDLQWAASGDASEVSPTVALVPAHRRTRPGWGIVAALALAMLTAGLLLGRRRRAPAPAEPVQFVIAPPQGTEFGGPAVSGTGVAAQVAVSPDGRNVVFVAGSQTARQLWIRPIGVMAPRAIPGTEEGAFPFWSPDGRVIGFFAGGKLKKVDPAGGPATILCNAAAGRGGSWNRDNVIVFAPANADTGLFRVSSAGGTPTAVTTLDPATGETNHRWPHFLPDGRHFLYTASTGTCCPAAKPAIIRIASIDPSKARAVQHGAPHRGRQLAGCGAEIEITGPFRTSYPLRPPSESRRGGTGTSGSAR